MFARLLIVAALSGAMSATAMAEPAGERRVYKQVEGRELSLYVFKPADWHAEELRPAVVFYHGGGWTGGAPGQFTQHAKYLAERGLVCFEIEYRLLSKSDNSPPVTCTQDAKSAMRWIRSHCQEFGVDPARIAAGGGSAGGHLAAFVGTVDGGDATTDDLSISAKANAMLLFNPVYDNGPGGWGTERVGVRYQEFSPLHNLSADDPPSIVFLGTEDKLIPVSAAEKFRDKSREVGVESELHTYDGQPHGFFNVSKDKGRWYRETLAASDRFLAKLGWLSGPPTIAESPELQTK